MLIPHYPIIPTTARQDSNSIPGIPLNRNHFLRITVLDLVFLETDTRPIRLMKLRSQLHNNWKWSNLEIAGSNSELMQAGFGGFLHKCLEKPHTEMKLQLQNSAIKL